MELQSSSRRGRRPHDLLADYYNQLGGKVEKSNYRETKMILFYAAGSRRQTKKYIKIDGRPPSSLPVAVRANAMI
jgi:bifunctional DNase/RNase